MRLVNIGFGNSIAENKIVAVISPDSAPIKRVIGESREKNSLIDATYGRKCKAVIITNSGHVILSAVLPETITARVNGSDDTKSDSE